MKSLAGAKRPLIDGSAAVSGTRRVKWTVKWPPKGLVGEAAAERRVKGLTGATWRVAEVDEMAGRRFASVVRCVNARSGNDENCTESWFMRRELKKIAPAAQLWLSKI